MFEEMDLCIIFLYCLLEENVLVGRGFGGIIMVKLVVVDVPDCIDLFEPFGDKFDYIGCLLMLAKRKKILV